MMHVCIHTPVPCRDKRREARMTWMISNTYNPALRHSFTTSNRNSIGWVIISFNKQQNMYALELCTVFLYFWPSGLSLPLFPFIRVRCCLQLFHRLICYSSPPSSVSCLLLPVSLLSCLLHISLYTVLPSLSLGLPRLLLPCSRNSAALFGSLS